MGNPDADVIEPVVAADTKEEGAYTPTKENQQQAKETEPQDQRLGNEDFDPRLLRNPTSKYEKML